VIHEPTQESCQGIFTELIMRVCIRFLLIETATLLLHTALSNSAIAETHDSSSVSFCALSSQIQIEKSHKTAAFLCWLMCLFFTQVEGIHSLLKEPRIHMPSDGF